MNSLNTFPLKVQLADFNSKPKLEIKHFDRQLKYYRHE